MGQLEAKSIFAWFLFCGAGNRVHGSSWQCSEKEAQSGAVAGGSSKSYRLGKGVLQAEVVAVVLSRTV